MANIVVAIYNSLRNTKGMFPYIETFLNELKKAGNNILCFEKNIAEIIIDSDLPEMYKKKIEEFNPDLFILFNNQFYDVSKYFDVPIIIYDIDSPNVYANIDLLKNNPRYKYLCITKSGKEDIPEILNCHTKDVCYIPPFTGVQTENINIERNIAFCGSHWLWQNNFNEFNNFILKKTSVSDREKAKQVYKTYLDNPCLQIDEIYDRYKINVKHKLEADNLYIFSTRLSGIKRLRYLIAIEDLGLEIRGQHWDNPNAHILKAFPELLLSYSPEIINNTITTQNFYNSSKIGFCTNHIQAKSGFSWRVCDILASNACLVTEKASDLFDFGFKVPTFESPIEAREQCKKILENENLRKDIIAHSQEIINKNHRFENILPIMEDFVGVNLHSNEVGFLEIVNTDKNSIFPEIEYKKLKPIDKIYYKISRHFYKKLIK